VKLLALDTATELCSAALWIDGAVRTREAWAPREHGSLILPMIAELLAEAELSGRGLDFIAFGRGPGAFTGLRLAASVAQGLGYAWGLALMPVSDLRALAARALPADTSGRVLACQDARMGELYWGCFERAAARGEAPGPSPHPLVPRTCETVSPPEQVELPQSWMHAPAAQSAVHGVGSGFAVHPQLIARLGAHLVAVQPQLRPHAREIADLAAQQGPSTAVAPERAEPVYLRDQVTRRS
jgi:tRNA threonylcarbamoyladenosine biosynthesis protein TsaB